MANEPPGLVDDKQVIILMNNPFKKLVKVDERCIPAKGVSLIV
jgi:hypothetical protein